MASATAGEARLAGQAWATLATILATSSCLVAKTSVSSDSGDSGQLEQLRAALAVLNSSWEAAALLKRVRSWRDGSSSGGSCLVLVGGGETTVTGK